MEITTILLVILCFLLLGREWSRYEKRINALERAVEKLEASNRQRLPYKAFEEILNAMTALDKEKTELEFHVSLIDNARGHIANAMNVGTNREK